MLWCLSMLHIVSAMSSVPVIAGAHRHNELPMHSPPSRISSRSTAPEMQSFNYKSGAELSQSSSRRTTADGYQVPRPQIHPMPDNPLAMLRKLSGHIKVSSQLISTTSCLNGYDWLKIARKGCCAALPSPGYGGVAEVSRVRLVI